MERVKVKGLDNFLNNLERIEKEMPKASKKMMNTIGEVVKGDIKLVTPVDTGELRSKNDFKIESPHEVVVFNNTAYADKVEYGFRTRAGTGKSVTRLYRKGKRVKLYVQGQYFMKRGIKNASPKIPLIVKKTLKAVLKNDNK